MIRDLESAGLRRTLLVLFVPLAALWLVGATVLSAFQGAWEAVRDDYRDADIPDLLRSVRAAWRGPTI